MVIYSILACCKCITSRHDETRTRQQRAHIKVETLIGGSCRTQSLSKFEPMTLKRRPTENGLEVTRAPTWLGHFFHVSALFTSTSPVHHHLTTSPCALQLPAFCCQSAIRRRFDYLTVHERNQPSAWSHPSSIHTSSHPQARTPPPKSPDRYCHRRIPCFVLKICRITRESHNTAIMAQPTQLACKPASTPFHHLHC
jgi:hypothetical protein